ncbi:hypothetical protein LSAT2_001818 [Lamellibrachia satsuma]|nr:hypothetical protein LSAT2_001818 [Lamellibrachia satsuma]
MAFSTVTCQLLNEHRSSEKPKSKSQNNNDEKPVKTCDLALTFQNEFDKNKGPQLDNGTGQGDNTYKSGYVETFLLRCTARRLSKHQLWSIAILQ